MRNKTILRPGFGRSAVLLPLLGVLLVSACDKSTKQQPGAAESAPGTVEATAESPAAAPSAEEATAAAPSRVEEAKAVMFGMMDALEKMAAALEGVKDEAGAKAAAEVIVATTGEMTGLAGKARALKEQMSAEEQKDMEAGPENEAKMKAIMERLSKAGAALPQDPAVQQALMPAMKSFGEAMRAMSGYQPSAAPESE